MCGISGVLFQERALHQKAIEEVTNMMSLMGHRGPDAQQLWQCKNAVFGHVRLSIIDLSSNANQPMESEDGNFVLTFNGEIYNFHSLRHLLALEGVTFKTNSDTEVVLYGCIKWGVVEFSKRAEGMWAFALYDIIKQTVSFSRDRLGQKPLFYCKFDKKLYFASTLTSLRTVIDDDSLCKESILFFIGAGFIPPTKSIYKRVSKVAPGSVQIHNLILKEECFYWKPNFSINDNLSLDSVLDLAERRIAEEINKCMISDVKVGFNLSGGIDSGLLVAIAKSNGIDINAFTLKVNNSTFDESVIATKLASSLNINHKVIPLKYDSLEYFDMIPLYHGEPFGDSSAIPSYFVAREISNYLKVVITGDGGDEAFAGYPIYQKLREKKNLFRLMNLHSNIVNNSVFWSRIVKLLPGPELLKNFLISGDKQFFLSRYTLDHKMRELLFKSTVLEDISQYKYDDLLETVYPQSTEKYDSISKMRFSDLVFNLPGDYNVKVDCANMANSIESRSPFLEHTLVDFVSRIDNNLLLKGDTPKYITKNLYYKLNPTIEKETQKRGFSIPIGSWILDHDMNDIAKYLLEGEVVKKEIVSKNGINKVIQDFVKSPINYKLLWNLLMLEVWFRNIHNKKYSGEISPFTRK